MFTGIIQALGCVVSNTATNTGRCLGIALSGLDPARMQPGDSIAVDGTCLTLKKREENTGYFDVSTETLDRCLIGHWKAGQMVNLELSLTLESRLGGHLVFGHVDGVGKLVHRREESEFATMRFEVDRSTVGRLIAEKGSVAVNGVSLTTNTVVDQDSTTCFEVMLVPHTLENTTFGTLREGGRVHLEVDQVARYIHRILEDRQP